MKNYLALQRGTYFDREYSKWLLMILKEVEDKDKFNRFLNYRGKIPAHSISVPCMPGPISYPKMPNAKFICLSHNSGLMFMSFVFPTNIVTW